MACFIACNGIKSQLRQNDSGQLAKSTQSTYCIRLPCLSTMCCCLFNHRVSAPLGQYHNNRLIWAQGWMQQCSSGVECTHEHHKSNTDLCQHTMKDRNRPDYCAIVCNVAPQLFHAVCITASSAYCTLTVLI